MPLPSVYADFNAIEYLDNERRQAEMALTGYGTLSSLARQKLQLQEGMALLLFEPNDIECEVTVHFDSERRDPAGRLGEWVARFDPRTIKDSVQPVEVSATHPCIACGQDFLAQQHAPPRNYTECCSHCGASVMAPMAAPRRAT
jgi:hypothetical protein